MAGRGHRVRCGGFGATLTVAYFFRDGTDNLKKPWHSACSGMLMRSEGRFMSTGLLVGRRTCL
jgi:hypothetical protein